MDNTYYIREMRRLYDEYISETERLEKDRKVTEGLMGIGQGLGMHPCHDRFSESLEQLIDAFAAKEPAAQTVYEVLAFMYDVPLKNRDNALAYWMLQAVHALTDKLIGFLTQEDAAALSARYKESYPKSVRMPAQNKILRLLQAQAGEERQRKSLFGFTKRRK